MMTFDNVREVLGAVPLCRKVDFEGEVVLQNFSVLECTPKTGGNFWLSVQASASHYCSPRENLPSLTDYEAVEVAISLWDSAAKTSKFVQPSVVGLSLEDNPSDAVLGWVLVTDLVEALKKFIADGGEVWEPLS